MNYVDDSSAHHDASVPRPQSSPPSPGVTMSSPSSLCHQFPVALNLDTAPVVPGDEHVGPSPSNLSATTSKWRTTRPREYLRINRQSTRSSRGGLLEALYLNRIEGMAVVRLTQLQRPKQAAR